MQHVKVLLLQDEALLIVSIARSAIKSVVDLSAAGAHGKVASLVKDRLESDLGEGGHSHTAGAKDYTGTLKLGMGAFNYYIIRLGGGGLN